MLMAQLVDFERHAVQLLNVVRLVQLLFKYQLSGVPLSRSWFPEPFARPCLSMSVFSRSFDCVVLAFVSLTLDISPYMRAVFCVVLVSGVFAVCLLDLMSGFNQTRSREARRCSAFIVSV